MEDPADAFLERAQRLADMAPASLGKALHAGDYADLFLENTHQKAVSCSLQPTGAPRWRMADQTDAGLGARIASGARQGFAWVASDEPLHWRLALDQAAAQLGARGDGSDRSDQTHLQEHWALALPPDPPEHLSDTELQALLLEHADTALAADQHVVGVEVELQAVTRRTVVASSEGMFVARVSTRLELRLLLTRTDSGKTFRGTSFQGSCGGFAPLFLNPPARLVAEALEQARRRGAARPIPAGDYPVVVAGGWGGVLLHEAIGHTLEADVAGIHRNGAPLLGERIGPSGLTLVDDPTAVGRRGTGTFDDEGATTHPTPLILEGEVAALLTDRAAAIRWNLPRTASGRRQDFRHLPQARMSNLRLLPGTTPAADLLAGVRDGLYIHRLGAGRFEPRDGTFSVEVLEAQRIEQGRLTTSVPAGALSGDTCTLPARILAITPDEVWDEGHGYCEKNGQIVPIGTAMPAIRIESLLFTPAD